MQKLEIGTRYRHYKGKEYKILGFARHSETLEEMVIYQALYDCPEFGTNALWARPKEMFSELITINDNQMPRFTRIND